MWTETLLNQVNTLSRQTIQLCFHCHKCTAGCPVADEMEYGPDQVLRMVQMGEKAALLTSHDIWLCAGCETCGTRCPNEIDIAQVMDALRQMALQEKAPVAEPDAYKFHRLFLLTVKYTGRLQEAYMLGSYKVWSRNLIADMDSGAKMILQGKVPFLPHRIKKHQDVKRLFEATLDTPKGGR